MQAGLPGFGLGTLFYGVLMLGMVGARLWCAAAQFGRRVGRLWWARSLDQVSTVRHRHNREEELARLP